MAHPATYQTLTESDGQAFYFIAPTHTHTIVNSVEDGIPSCGDCHSNDALLELEEDEKITVLTCKKLSPDGSCFSGEQELVHRTGIIPIPSAWRRDLRFVFLNRVDVNPP